MVTVETKTPAPRVRGLAGLRLAVLDNSKWNAGKLLRGIARELEGSFRLDNVRFYTKESFSKTATAEMLATIVSNSDIALTAIGD